MNLNKKIVKTLLILAFAFTTFSSVTAEAATSTDPLSGSCSADLTEILQEESVTWSVTASGGSETYDYQWGGDDGITGTSDSVNHTYNNPGGFNAEVTISDGDDEILVECDDTVNVIAFLEFVSCEAYEIAYTIGYGSTHWFATLKGGRTPYTVDWSGDDGLTGDGINSDDITYTTPGEKNAQISSIESSDGQVINFAEAQICSPNMTVYEEEVPEAPLSVSCSADKNNADINENVTWSVNISGGTAPYSISWNGTGGLAGTDTSTTTSYSTEGTKSASVIVRDSDTTNPAFVNTSCGDTEVAEEETETTSSASGRRSSGGGSSNSNNDDDDNEEETDNEDEENDNNNDEEEEELTEEEIINVLQALNTTQTSGAVTNTVNTGVENQDVNNETATDDVESDEENTEEVESSDNDQLAAIGAVNFEWLDNFVEKYWSILLITLILAIFGTSYFIWKRNQINK
jgi:hypothetical protein